MRDQRLDAHLALLTAALAGYLRQLRLCWTAPVDDQLDPEVARIVAGVGARPAPAARETAGASALLVVNGDGPLARIAAALELSPGEEALVAGAWWSEVDPQLSIVLGCAHDDAARRFASVALLRLVLEPFGLELPAGLDDASPLVANGVIEAGAGATGPLRLTATARLVLAGELPRSLFVDRSPPTRLGAETAALARRLRSGAAGVTVLRGPAGIGRTAVAAAAAAEVGLVPVGAGRAGS